MFASRLFSSVRARLLLLVLIAALPLVVVLLVFAAQSRQRELATRRESALHAAQLLANDTGKVILSTEQLMRWISQFPEVQSDDVASCNTRLEQLLANTQGYWGFVVTDPDGTTAYLAPRGTLSPSAALDTSASPYFRLAMQNEAFSVAGIITGRLSGRPNLSFGYPVVDAQGNVTRVIGAGLNVDALNALLGDTQPPGGVAMVLDAKGNVVMHSLGLEGYVGRPHPNANLVRTILADTTGVTETYGVDQVERAYAFAPYRLGEGGNGQPVLYAVMGYPLADLYAAADADLARSLLIMGLIILGTLLLAWLAGHVMIVRRANTIIRAAKRLAAGDLTVRTGLAYGAGELSQLAHDFDDMAAALERHQLERDKVEADLVTSEIRHRLLVEAMTTVEWATDPAGNLTERQPVWEAYTGQQWPDYAGDGWLRMYHPDDRADIMRIWRDGRTAKQTVEAAGRLWHAASQGYRHCAVRAVPRLDANGDVMEWVGANTDVHDRKVVEQASAILADVGASLAQTFPTVSPLASLPSLLTPRLADWCTAATCNPDGALSLVATAHAAGAERQEPTPRAIFQVLSPERDHPDLRLDVKRMLATHPALGEGQPCLLEVVNDEVLQAVTDSPEHLDQLRRLRESGMSQCLFVPLMLRGQRKLAGLLTLGMVDDSRKFAPADLGLMREVAQRAALSLENASLYETEKLTRQQAEQSARYLAQLNHLAARLTPALSRGEVIQAILDDIATGIHADAAAVNLMHEDGHSLSIVQSYGYPSGALATVQRYTVEDSVPGARVVRTGEPLWFESHQDFHLQFPHLSHARQTYGIHASAFMPMAIDGRVIGLLALSFLQPRAFSAEDKSLLLTFASQCAQALERARLYDAEQRSRQQAERSAGHLSRLLDFTTQLSRAVTSQHIHATLLDAAMAGVGADKGAVYVRTPDGEHMRVAHAAGYAPETVNAQAVLPLSANLPLGTVIRTARPVWLDSLDAFQDTYSELIPAQQAIGQQACATVPIVLNGHAIGGVSLGFERPTALSNEQKALIQGLAGQAASSLERANLYESQTQARKRAERNAAYLERLQEVTSALSLSDAITPPDVTAVILDALMASYGATTGAISLLSDAGDALVLSCARGYAPDVVATFERISFDRPLASVEAAKTGRPVWLESQDAYLARYPRARTDFVRFRDHACAVVPVRHSGRLLGVIALNFDVPRAFSAEDKSLLMTFSAQCGQALERARLYQRQKDANAQLELRVQARTRELTAANAQLLSSREELRELHKRMLTAIEAERERIAREVHDELGQLLTVVRLEVGRARRDIAAAQPAVAELLQSGLDLVDQSMRSVRRIATELRPVILNDLGLEAALEWQLQEFGARTGVKCTFDRAGGWAEPDRETATAAFRIIQESLTNVLRHAQATQVSVTMAANDRRLLLMVCDNGVGVGNTRVDKTRSFGVRSMKERATGVGGRLKIRDAPGGGTVVVLVLPLTELPREVEIFTDECEDENEVTDAARGLAFPSEDGVGAAAETEAETIQE